MVSQFELCVKREVHSEFSVNQDSPTGSGLWRMITRKQCRLNHETNRSPLTLHDPTSHTNCSSLSSLPSVPILCPFLIYGCSQSSIFLFPALSSLSHSFSAPQRTEQCWFDVKRNRCVHFVVLILCCQPLHLPLVHVCHDHQFRHFAKLLDTFY